MTTGTRRSEKLLIVRMSNGAKYAVPAEVVAHNRANFYREDGYRAEYDYTLGDDAELEDWAANNMNWEDVRSYAFCYSLPDPPDMQEGWVSGEKDVVPNNSAATIPNDIGEIDA